MLSSESPSFTTPEGVDAVQPTRHDETRIRAPTPPRADSQDWPQRSSVVEVTTATATSLPKQERRHSEPSSSMLPAPSSQDSELNAAPAMSQSYSSSNVGYLSNRWHVNDPFSRPTNERPREEPFRYVRMHAEV